jgi:hypothetical protein
LFNTLNFALSLQVDYVNMTPGYHWNLVRDVLLLAIHFIFPMAEYIMEDDVVDYLDRGTTSTDGKVVVPKGFVSDNFDRRKGVTNPIDERDLGQKDPLLFSSLRLKLSAPTSEAADDHTTLDVASQDVAAAIDDGESDDDKSGKRKVAKRPRPTASTDDNDDDQE